ncbi:DUF1801 domain-containing protein [Sphingomonas sp. NPDC092331]|jgi:hypothetical protein|uniref:DUF1801 domain-containing protein n=1 Tax=unclassified Sphingomonas TaxID=196159 RepID=UPI0029EB05E1|nr:DUF1801 domain-containing protein [Pseudomonadota bacterium]
MAAGSVPEFLDALDPAHRAAVEALRALVAEAAPGLVEELKWNAPSFRDAQDHKVTLGIDRKGGIRIVLHRGATAKAMPGFRFEDPAGLAQWPAPDRGVIQLRDADDVIAHGDALRDIVRRWVAATA